MSGERHGSHCHISALRHERQTRVGHHMLAHLRQEAYGRDQDQVYPPRANADAELSYEENVARIRKAKGGD